MYKVICNKEVLFAFDINMLVLFGLSLLTIIVAFHTPELRMIQKLSQEELQETEFKTWQAVGFFVGASVMITLMYLFMEYIMVVITVYITCASTIALAVISQDFLSYSKYLFPRGPDQMDALPNVIKIPCVGSFTWFDLKCIACSAVVSGGWLLTKNWILNNILGISMAIVFLKTIKLNKLIPGALLLSLLFFYDIFFVFYSQNFTKGG